MTTSPVFSDIEATLQNHPVVLFMKGVPKMPMCGFSGFSCQVLDRLGVPFQGVNVLADEALRQGIKDFTNWPTIPQLYVKGTFIGGADIIRDMYESGELKTLFDEHHLTAKAPAVETS